MRAGNMTAAVGVGAGHLDSRTPCQSQGCGPAAGDRNGGGRFHVFPERPGHDRHGDDKDRHEA